MEAWGICIAILLVEVIFVFVYIFVTGKYKSPEAYKELEAYRKRKEAKKRLKRIKRTCHPTEWQKFMDELERGSLYDFIFGR